MNLLMKFTPIIIFIVFNSCTINSHIMLKTDKDFVFDDFPISHVSLSV